MLGVVLGVSKASNGVAVGGIDPQVGGAGIGHNSELLVVTSELDVDEVLSVHVVLHGDMCTSGIGSGNALKALLLLHIVGDGERVVAERDLVSRDKSEHGSEESGSVHSRV